VEQRLIELALLLQYRCEIGVGGRKLRKHLQRLQIQPRRLLYIPLLPLDIRQIVQRVGVGGTQLEGGVVALLRLRDEALLLERVGQVAVGVGEVGLQFDGTPVGVDGEVDEALRVSDSDSIRSMDQDPYSESGSRRAKMTHISRKNLEISCFKVLDVLF
jgi:hypothetical protein